MCRDLERKLTRSLLVMATATQTIGNPPGFLESRPTDYLYDPCCLLSSEKDQAKQLHKAFVRCCDTRYVPAYVQLFRQIADRPQISLFRNRNYHTLSRKQTEECREEYSKDTILGPHLWKYYRRPALNLLHPFAASTAAMNLVTEPFPTSTECQSRPKQTRTKHRATQTDYRESEAQTDPYSPDYRVVGETEPELLTLSALTWGNGLPAGQSEITLIERARAKRALEAKLPSLNREQLDKRLKMMAEIEGNEWLFREKQLEEISQMRLDLMKQMVTAQKEQFSKNTTDKLSRLWRKKQIEKEKRIHTIRTQHYRALHKIVEKRRSLDRQFVKQTIGDKYLDPSSEVYAPLTRSGRAPLTSIEEKKINSKILQSYKGVQILEKNLPSNLFELGPIKPQLPTIPQKGYVKRDLKFRKAVEDAFQDLQREKKQKLKGPPVVDISELMERLEKPPPRPLTPEEMKINEADEQVELATIFIQKILRGRAVQIMMSEGKDTRFDLVIELRTTKALYEHEQHNIDKENRRLQEEQIMKLEAEERSEQLDSIVGSIGGATVARLLDFLSKELTRLQDERRIHAIALLAERQRRIREAEESGLRQLEERRRREEEEIFRQVLKVHQKSLDVYLEDVILASIHTTADSQARQEIQALARKVNDATYEFEARRTTFESEEMVAELVHSFLLPEVQKMTVREKVRRKQHAALLAAHDHIYKDVLAPVRPASISTSSAPSPSVDWGMIESENEATEAAEPASTDWHDTDALENWMTSYYAQMEAEEEWHHCDGDVDFDTQEELSISDFPSSMDFFPTVSRVRFASRQERYSRESWRESSSED